MIYPRTTTDMLKPLSCFSLVDVTSLEDATERCFTDKEDILVRCMKCVAEMG